MTIEGVVLDISCDPEYLLLLTGGGVSLTVGDTLTLGEVDGLAVGGFHGGHTVYWHASPCITGIGVL